MSDPRKPAFDGVITAAKAAGVPNPFNDPGNLHAFQNMLDAWKLPRETGGGSVPRRSLSDAPAFFAGVRKITGPLDAVQVETINDLLKAAAHWPIGWVAYGLATAWHECRLKPIAEWGKGAGRPYAKSGKYGQPQYGRGLVQLTWDGNYEWADKALGLDGSLLANFDRALEPAIATAILVKGMEEGAFTGKKLADYIKDRGTVQGFTSARRIINGTDKAPQIAGYAVAFLDALEKGQWK